MSALARRLGVNASSVSRWEDGSCAPDPEMLIVLAGELRVRPEYFLRPRLSGSRPVFFRSLASTYVRDLAYQRAQMARLQEISAVLQHYVDLPAVDVPDVLAGRHYRQLDEDDLEAIALDLRRHWGLGEGPCGNMVTLLERIGVVVGSIEMGTAKLDGLCGWPDAEERPYILLAADKTVFARRQMDAAHELAHALLHRRVTGAELKADLPFIETQAFRLASAFLMPSTTYPLEVRTPSLATLLMLKERWRVSVKAQVKRLSDLGVIGGDNATHLYKLYSAKGWSKGEPLDRDHWEFQQPRMLADAVELIVSSGVRGKADLLAVEFTLPPGDVENLCNLPAGWFSREKAEVVQLRMRSEGDGPRQGAGGTLVPFPGRPSR